MISGPALFRAIDEKTNGEETLSEVFVDVLPFRIAVNLRVKHRRGETKWKEFFPLNATTEDVLLRYLGE